MICSVPTSITLFNFSFCLSIYNFQVSTSRKENQSRKLSRYDLLMTLRLRIYLSRIVSRQINSLAFPQSASWKPLLKFVWIPVLLSSRAEQLQCHQHINTRKWASHHPIWQQAWSNMNNYDIEAYDRKWLFFSYNIFLVPVLVGTWNFEV